MSETEKGKERDGPPPEMLWPTAVGQDAFVDFSRSPSRESREERGGGELKNKSEKEKEKNNKGDQPVGEQHSPRKEKEKERHPEALESGNNKREEMVSMKDMKERIKMKTGVFRKHLTEYLKEMSSPSSTTQV